MICVIRGFFSCYARNLGGNLFLELLTQEIIYHSASINKIFNYNLFPCSPCGPWILQDSSSIPGPDVVSVPVTWMPFGKRWLS